MLPKGCLWVMLAVLAIAIIVIVSILLDKEEEWCNESLFAGECDQNQLSDTTDNTCYCIDRYEAEDDVQKLGVYESAQNNCQMLNGSLATPGDNQVLVWLSKRMYKMGVDNALLGLRKIAGVWVWDFAGEEWGNASVLWRTDFPPNPNHTYATINVQTFKVFTEKEYNQDDDSMGYKTYNYRHYVENDKSYQWYGLTSSDNNENVLRGSYYICHYKLAPDPSLIQKPKTTTTVAITANSDPCFCSNNERIILSNLDDSATFQSPRYPSNYCSDHNCRWMIVSNQAHLAIKLEWLVFDVETNMDFVHIYDGEMTDSPKMASCTGSTCADEKSTANAMQVNFVSDHVTTDLGFKFRVTAVETDECYCSKSASLTFANLHETYTLVSPRYPDPYCTNHDCSWSFTAPQGHGIQIMSNQLDEHSSQSPYSTLIDIYDGDDALKEQQSMRCGGMSSCDNFVSSSETLHIHFKSGSKESKKPGFKATVTVVKNYCETNELKSPLHGSVSYSDDLRQDGRAAVYTNAILQCSNYSGIIATHRNKKDRTLEVTIEYQDSVQCQSPKWLRDFKQCVPLCDVRKEFFLSSETSDYTAHICTQDQKLAPDRTVSAITEKEFNLLNGQLGAQIEYSCKNGSWTPKPPLCHYSGILLIRGYGRGMESMLIFSPTTKTIEYVPLDLLEEVKDGISASLGDIVLLAGGGETSPKSSSQILDLGAQTVKRGPNMNVARSKAAATSIGDKVFVCGGVVSEDDKNISSSCEVYQNNQWKIIEPMRTARRGHVLIAHRDSVYAISGYNYDIEYISAVEKYSISTGTWEFVAPPITDRYHMGAALFNDKIFVCGGSSLNTFGDLCEVYDPNQNVWQDMDAKMPGTMPYVFWLVAFADKLYAVGGDVELATIYSYVEGQEVWSKEFEWCCFTVPSDNSLWVQENSVVAVPLAIQP